MVLWKFKFCAKNHLVKIVILNWCIKYTNYIHKGTVQRHLCLIEGVSLPLRGKQGVFSIKKLGFTILSQTRHQGTMYSTALVCKKFNISRQCPLQPSKNKNIKSRIKRSTALLWYKIVLIQERQRVLRKYPLQLCIAKKTP